MRDESQLLIKQAESDLGTSKNSLNSGDYYASVFWSQQCVEKCLKSILSKKKGGYAKIHDLVALSKKAGVSDDLIDKVKRFIGIHTETRYGFMNDETPSEKFKEEDAVEFLQIAKEVFEWTRKKI
jgi:HEPN domain-containing protein